MHSLLQDLRYALRQLRKSPGFTFIVVLMLALGIGANTAVFSVMNAILMQLLPVSHPESLTIVRLAQGFSPPPGTGTVDANSTFPEVVFEALRQRTDVFQDLVAYVPLSFSGSTAVRHGELPEQAEGDEVSGNFFSGIGVPLALGRGFSLDDEKNHTPLAVLSYDYWTRSFSRDPAILGQTLYVKGVPLTIVGVTARGFHGVEPATSTDFWIPLQTRPELNAWGAPEADNSLYGTPTWWCLRMMARLRPGVSPLQAQQALAGTFGQIVQQALGTINPRVWKPLLDFTPVRGIAGYDREYREPVRILMGLVALVLLIACTNVAMMVQARNTVRQREFSLRLAIGAGKAAIFRQLLCESVLLVTAGSALGWMFALSATRMLSSWSGIETGLSPDRTVLLFTLLLSALAALTFGLVPLLSAMRAPVAGVLRSSSTGLTASRTRAFGGRIVLAGQVAVCLVLLMAALLLMRTLRNYATENLGMPAQELFVFGVTPQGQADAHPFYRTLLERIREVPGVEAVSVADERPGSGGSNNRGLTLDGVVRPGEHVRSNDVGPGFFHTMGVPILAGRDISESDTQTSPYVALVNETFVKRFLANTNPLGHHIDIGPFHFTIVGVVRDSKFTSVDEKPMPMSYQACMQAPALSTMNVEVRTRGSALSIQPEIRQAVASLDPNIPLEMPMTQQQQFEQSYEKQRMFAAMGGFFGLLAALLVATGLYGMHSFRVSRRTTEIGIRMALGASRGQVLAMVMREGLWVLLAGLAVGIPLTVLAARPLKSMLYQMSPFDPVSFALAIAAMVVVSACAALVPARRAASIEPMQALRSE
jgi:predicted permease